MKKDHTLFIVSTLLIATHVTDRCIQSNVSPWFYLTLFVLPLVVVSLFWHKMSDVLRLSLVTIFFLLESNEVATVTIPAFVEEGLVPATRNGLLFIPAVVLFLVVAWIVAVRIYKEKT